MTPPDLDSSRYLHSKRTPSGSDKDLCAQSCSPLWSVHYRNQNRIRGRAAKIYPGLAQQVQRFIDYGTPLQMLPGTVQETSSLPETLEDRREHLERRDRPARTFAPQNW